jgi:uncharacterized Fe-S radical SAM superfamily protein PflX
MDQYHPDTFTDPRSPAYDDRYADLARHPNRDEIETAFRYAKKRGIHFETVTYERNKTGFRI